MDWLARLWQMIQDQQGKQSRQQQPGAFDRMDGRQNSVPQRQPIIWREGLTPQQGWPQYMDQLPPRYLQKFIPGQGWDQRENPAARDLYQNWLDPKAMIQLL